MSTFRGFWRRLRCLVRGCGDTNGMNNETLRKMDQIPTQLDRLIDKRIRNNIIESAYLERLRREGDTNGR